MGTPDPLFILRGHDCTVNYVKFIDSAVEDGLDLPSCKTFLWTACGDGKGRGSFT